MFLVLLIVYGVALLIPPVDAGPRLYGWLTGYHPKHNIPGSIVHGHQTFHTVLAHWSGGPELWLWWNGAVALKGLPLFVVSILGSYVLLSMIASELLRSRFPGVKPRLLLEVTGRDILGICDLILMFGGVALAIVGMVVNTDSQSKTVIVLAGVLIAIGMFGHAWEMAMWIFDEREAKRLTWRDTLYP